MDTAVTPRSRPPLLIGTVLSGLIAALTLVAVLAPRLPLYRPDGETAMLVDLIGAAPSALITVLTALVGTAGGIAALAGALPRRGLIVTAAAQVLVFGVAMSSINTLSVVGYLIALAMPLLVVTVLAGILRRYRVARWVVALPALLAALAGLLLGRDLIAELLGDLLPSLLDRSGQMVTSLSLLATGIVWSAAVVMTLHGTPAARRATDWVTRHRRVFTVVAACGPLPYAIARLSWLTPWPLLGGEQTADPTTHLWGIMLSGGCWLGMVLTLSLITSWGEVFPRWMPVVAGRPVPPTAAVVPGGAVAGLLCFVAVPLLHSAASLGAQAALVFAIAFPAWFWGPSLALAVWGYAGHRRGRSTADRAGAGALAA